MVKDAEAHAEEDRKAKELIETRNMAENMIHVTKKSLNDLGDKVEEQIYNGVLSSTPNAVWDKQNIPYAIILAVGDDVSIE